MISFTIKLTLPPSDYIKKLASQAESFHSNEKPEKSLKRKVEDETKRSRSSSALSVLTESTEPSLLDLLSVNLSSQIVPGSLSISPVGLLPFGNVEPQPSNDGTLQLDPSFDWFDETIDVWPSTIPSQTLDTLTSTSQKSQLEPSALFNQYPFHMETFSDLPAQLHLDPNEIITTAANPLPNSHLRLPQQHNERRWEDDSSINLGGVAKQADF
jgi:hypothetical protein